YGSQNSRDSEYTREFQNLQKPERYLHGVHTSRQRSGTQCSAVEAGPIHNLLGAEVRGKVDGAFDSGLLVTATANGKIFRGVLFAPGTSDFVPRGPMLAQSLSKTHQAGATQPFLNSTNFEPLKPSRPRRCALCRNPVAVLGIRRLMVLQKIQS
ncbi:uncharacterized protein LOC120163877, partial [Hibiscus syriacus]|uniref:uncharacterized protein LOC120163877 n=1 Tax=Hibiscus syriacus TaxID=106335 RepID=UPI001921EC25